MLTPCTGMHLGSGGTGACSEPGAASCEGTSQRSHRADITQQQTGEAGDECNACLDPIKTKEPVVGIINLSAIRSKLWIFAPFALLVTAAWLAQPFPAVAQNPDQTEQAQLAPISDTERATGSETLEKGEPPSVGVGEPALVDAEPPAEPAPKATERQPRAPQTYQLWVLMPALIAILLAILTRQVVPALVVGVVVGAYMMVPCLPADGAYASQHSIVAGFRLAAETYVIGAIHEPPSANDAHIKIILFTLVIGFMVGVLGRNGGTAGVVRLVAGRTESPRRGALTAWLAGLVVFFDDYSNTMIVGPTMRSVFDRLKMSRAKLAYIVDSTAAPVASLALIGTWVGAEIAFIQTGLDQVGKNAVPAFLTTDGGAMLTGMQAFVYSIPYRFYPILALFLVFLIALTGRDFGPMKRSESAALRRQEEGTGPASGTQQQAGPAPCWWLGLVPVLILLAVTIGVLIVTGYDAAQGRTMTQQSAPFWERAYKILENSDAYLSIMYGALLAAIGAMLLTMLKRACSIRDAADAGLEGAARMCPALVILVLAWALSAVEQDLALGPIVTEHLKAASFPAEWMPLAIFVCAAGISFATGTSWGTMGILCPVAVTIMAGIAAEMPPDKAQTLFYACVGSVLAGAIFGDHCSPISDTTVLSSVAAGCRHEEHVWTQIPYATVGAIAAMGFGDVMCSVYDQPWYYGLGAGAVFLLLVVLIFGRRVKPLSPPPDDGPPISSLRGPASTLEQRLHGTGGPTTQ